MAAPDGGGGDVCTLLRTHKFITNRVRWKQLSTDSAFEMQVPSPPSVLVNKLILYYDEIL